MVDPYVNTYQGWSNYATWSVNSQWVCDNAETHGALLKMAQIAVSCGSELREQATIELADALQELFESANPWDERNDVFGDLLASAIKQVNWFEIAGQLYQTALERYG